MKINNGPFSRKRKIILTCAGILYNVFLFFMISYGFKLNDLIGLSVFTVVFMGILFLWVE